MRKSSPPRHASTFCVIVLDVALTRRYRSSLGLSITFLHRVWRVTTHCSWRGGGLTRGLRMAVTARISLSLASAVPSRESGDSACDGLFS